MIVQMKATGQNFLVALLFCKLNLDFFSVTFLNLGGLSSERINFNSGLKPRLKTLVPFRSCTGANIFASQTTADSRWVT